MVFRRTFCADSNTRSNIDSVRRLVCVFLWLGWYDAINVIGGSGQVPSWRNFGAGEKTSWPVARHVRRNACIATAPRTTTTGSFRNKLTSAPEHAWHQP